MPLLNILNPHVSTSISKRALKRKLKFSWRAFIATGHGGPGESDYIEKLMMFENSFLGSIRTQGSQWDRRNNKWYKYYMSKKRKPHYPKILIVEVPDNEKVIKDIYLLKDKKGNYVDLSTCFEGVGRPTKYKDLISLGARIPTPSELIALNTGNLEVFHETRE
jgi:hypothetical protein